MDLIMLPNKSDFSKSSVASFDVDAQKGFTPLCPDELPVPGGDDIVPELNMQARFARFRVGSKDAHSRNALWAATKENPQFSKIIGDDMDVRWNMHCEIGTKGFELLDGLPDEKDYDYFVWKGIEPDMHPYGACYHDIARTLSTGVIEFLWQKRVRVVIVEGLATDYCVKHTVNQLLAAGFTVVVNLGACRAVHSDDFIYVVKGLRAAGAIMIDSARDLEIYQ